MFISETWQRQSHSLLISLCTSDLNFITCAIKLAVTYGVSLHHLDTIEVVFIDHKLVSLNVCCSSASFPQVCIRSRSFIDDCINAKFSSDDVELHSYGLKLLGSTSLSSISNIWAAKADRVVTGRAVEICCHPQVDGCHSGGARGGCSSWFLLVSISWRVSASSLR